MAGEVRSIEFRLLGPPEVVAGGHVVPIGSLQQRAILVALLLARDTVVSTEQLIDVIWGDEPPPAPPQRCGASSGGSASASKWSTSRAGRTDTAWSPATMP